MFEKPEERIRMLKAGINPKTIERIYIETNNIKRV